MIFDTHAHYDDDAFNADRDELLRNLPENGISRVVNSGSSLKGCEDTIRLTEKYGHVYGSLGIHPCDTPELSEERFEWLRGELMKPKIVAVGEIGLDYYWDEPDRSIQKTWFERQLLLAGELNKPIVIHSREAAKDTLDMLKSDCAKGLTGVMHCFSYSAEMAREYVNMGYYLGIGGVITFKNARKLTEAVEYAPIENLVLETDCPYLAPAPHRGKRNTSLMLNLVVEAIAGIKGISAGEVEEITFRNALRLYKMEV